MGTQGGGVFFLVPGTKRHKMRSEGLSLCPTYSGVIFMPNDHVVKVGLCAPGCVRLNEVLYAGVLWLHCDVDGGTSHCTIHQSQLTRYFSLTRPLCRTCAHTPVDGSQLMGELVFA